MAQITSLAASLRAAPWRLSLLHDVAQRRLIWITHGQGRAILSPRRHGLGVHNLLHIPPGAPFALDPGPGLNGHVLTLGEEPTRLWPDAPLLLRIRETGPQTEMTGLLEAMLREQSAQRPRFEGAMDAYLPLISIWLHRVMADPDMAPDSPSAADLLSEALLADIAANFRKGEPMAGIAARLGVTPTHLSRVAKEQFGRSAADLLNDRSLHAARDLLETTRHPAKAIAKGLGFGSASAFTRFVSAQTGTAPRALRKAAQSRIAPPGAAGPVTRN